MATAKKSTYVTILIILFVICPVIIGGIWYANQRYHLLAKIELLTHHESYPVDWAYTWQQHIATLQSEAQSKQTQQAWNSAIIAYQEILKLDPANEQAKKNLDIVEQARDDSINLEQAQQAMLLGQYMRALLLSSKIRLQSTYTYAAQAVHERALSALLEQTIQRANVACKQGNWQMCREIAIVSLTYNPYFTKGAAMLVEAEEGLLYKHQTFVPWNGRKWIDTQKLKKLYKDKAMRAAILRYGTGDIDTALQYLQKMHRNRKTSTAYRVADSIMHIKQYKYEAEVEAANHNLKQATTLWQRAIAEDEKLLPAEYPDAIRYDLRKRLGQALLTQGRDAFDRGLYTEAYLAWSKGLNMRQNSKEQQDEIRNWLQRLEKRADSLLHDLLPRTQLDSAMCNRLADIMGMTSPESTTYVEAQKKLPLCKPFKTNK